MIIDDLKNILLLLRIQQWVKNVFILAGLIFSRNLLNIQLLERVSVGFILFSLGASSIYIFNDIRDIKKDREHPEKSNRPLAAGKLHPAKAYSAAILLSVFSLIGAFYLDRFFFGILALYISMNIAYSLKMKHMVILDVMCIAFGFVFRVIAGTILAGVNPSDWLILCTIMLALFLGLGKRRQEIALIGADSIHHRNVLSHYSITFLDQMIAVATACTVMSYALYTIADETVIRFGTRNLILTIPFVIYGIYRYLYLVHQKKAGGNPTNATLTDFPLIINGLLWLISVVIVIYFA